MDDEKLEIKDELVGEIIDILSKCFFKDKIEVLANVFLTLGFNEMSGIDVESIRPSTLYKEVLAHVKKHGDTLGNTLTRQGLVLLSWLETGEKDE